MVKLQTHDKVQVGGVRMAMCLERVYSNNALIAIRKTRAAQVRRDTGEPIVELTSSNFEDKETFGRTTETNTEWTKNSACCSNCSSVSRLYCFER